MKNIFRIIAILYFAQCLFCIEAKEKSKISGTVTDETGFPLPAVNIFIQESREGTTSDENGLFTLITSATGQITLRVSMVGYSAFTQKIDLSENQHENMKIILSVESIELKEAVVIGSSFSSESQKGVVVSSIDVMTTPGGAADLYQSLKTMPGVTQVSESAELYVRGGDPSETITIIDQASIYHPYTLESSYGGLFSNLNTSAVSEMYFSSGGFSVKYGNVLSGVLDIQTKDLPTQLGLSAGISLAASSLSAELPILQDKLGIRIYGQKSYTKPIMWFNGGLKDFTAAPSSQNLTTTATFKFSQSGKIKFTGILADDKQGVNIQRAEFNGVFNGNSETALLNLQLTQLIGNNTILKSSISYASHDNNWRLGILDIDMVDESYLSRTDVEHTFSDELQLLTGFEFEKRRQTYVGIIPEEDYDIRPEASNDILNEKIEENRFGGYAEIKILDLFGVEKLFAVAGIRTDHFVKLDITNLDLRTGLGYQIAENSKIRFAFGSFHQVPDFRLYAKEDGNPNLKSMKALHYVLSYDYEIDQSNSFRLELFHKNYDNLPLEENGLNFNNNGYGYATGIDMILKGNFPLDIQGWISYGFINTKRKWMEYDELTNSSFDITHNLTVVLKYNISPIWQVGINLKYATGKPYSPITGSVYHQEINLYEPLYGKDNSSRYPDYKRLDIRLTYLNQIFKNLSTIFYIEGLNILDIKNLFDYTYNRDYSCQQRIESYFGRRTIVVGAIFAL